MLTDVSAIRAFVAVATAGGFRAAAASSGVTASGLSGGVRRLEDRMGVRLLHRTTRSVVPTEVGDQVLGRLRAALADMEAALDVANDHRQSPSGTIRLNVPINVARIVLPRILPGFVRSFPDVRVEVVAEQALVDILAAGFDAGVRYGERLTKNMVAVPIGPARQRFATAASPSYLAARCAPSHPNDLKDHACLSPHLDVGSATWEFESAGEVVRIEPRGPIAVDGGALDLAVSAAVGGCGIVHLFEELLRPALDNGTLVPVLEPWWQAFEGPYLYYHGRDRVPVPLRAFIDYVEAHRW